MASFKIDESVFDKLAGILKKHELSEIEYVDGDVKIRIASSSNKVCENIRFVDNNNSSSQNKQNTDVNIIDNNNTDNLLNHKGALKSPMVGTCYLSPEPGAKPFVMVGDNVQEGQPVLIIEAMKVMNLIKAHKSGKIIHIAVNNAEPIEFGQLLLVIE